ncbi:MAG TPA: hypothetical protein VK968_10195 [Roseimicrobium sp.]|nr:hypothetical protein [Roseimicrobium sp.]
MNSRSVCLGGLLLAGLFSAIVTTGFAAEPAATVFHRKSGLIAGWSYDAWGNLTVESSKSVAKEAGGLSLAVTPTASAAPYAGLQMGAGSSGDIALGDLLRKGGEVHLYLRNGNDQAGQPALPQSLQVMLSFQAAGGKVINGKYEPVVLETATADMKTPAGWALIKISIPGQLQGKVDPAAPVKLHGVYVQYIDQPAAGYFVGECVVVNKPAK